MSSQSKTGWTMLASAGVAMVLGVLLWQGVIAHGNPDPTDKSLSPSAMALSSGVLVFREGFEVVLFLQDLRLKAGTGIVLTGASIGLSLTLIV